nr:glycosyl hydrolase-related protein [Paenibacillus aceris]
MVLHHSHLDVGYTHAQPILLELQKEYIDQALLLCEQTEDWPENCKFRWTCESSYVVLKWLETSDLRQIEKFKHYLHNGQMSISASFMHTAPLCSAEVLAKMLSAVKKLRDQFDIRIKTAIHHDVNGQPWPYSQLLMDAGVEFFMMGINVHFGGIPLTRPMAFHWEAPDKRKLLTFHGEHYSLFGQICNLHERDTQVIADGLAKYLKRFEDMPDYPFDFAYLTATNLPLYDNNPPDRELASLLRKWNEEGHEQTISFVTPEQLYERVKRHEQKLSVHAGDWTDYWNFGSASSAKEVKLSRKTKQGMKAVELLDAFEPIQELPYQIVKKQAWEQIQLFDEHTWGAFNSTTEPEHLNVAIQWMHKAHYAYQANSLTGFLLGKQMEKLAHNPLQSDKPEGLLLVNPSPATLTYEIRIPSAFQIEGCHLAADRMRHVLMNHERMESGDSYGTVELKPFSWREIPFQSMQIQEQANDIVVENGRIETPHHICTFDSTTGRITGVYDKKLKWHVLDSSSPWTFFQYVQETIDPLYHPEDRSTIFPRDIEKGNNSISVWNHEWKAKRSTYTSLKQCMVERAANSATLVLKWDAPGVSNLEQRITFFNYRPEIELKASFHKQDITTPEGTYFAFPLQLDKWQCHYDTAGQMVELDKEQLPGVCRDWITVDKQVSMYDGFKGVTLACPDAPLVQVGGFNFGKEQKEIPRDPNPLLLAWPMNNYWDTNYRAHQPGYASFTYVLSTFQNFDETQATMAGTRAITPVLALPVIHCAEGQSGQWIECKGDGAVLYDIKQAEDGNGVILRLVNVKNESVDTQLRFPKHHITSASVVNVLEEDKTVIENNSLESEGLLSNNGVHVSLKSKQMIHMRLHLTSA